MSNREIFIEKLRQLSKEEMLERYIALLNTEKLTDYVADLEAKLAEKEYLLNIKDGELNNTHELWQNKIDEVKDLKQQLAEKEKEIERLKHIERYDIGEMFLENAKLIIEKRQFAIQQLQRVKEEMHRGLEFDYDLDIWATEFIDTIINEIKGE